jgi:hypothetical protein
MSEPLALRILEIILETIGAAIVRRKVDEWEAARAAAEAQATGILGPRPR